MKTSLQRRQDIKTDKIAQYERMVEIREFEEQINALFAAGLVRGSTHLCQGQEALDVGIAAADIDQLASDAMLQTRLLMNSPREITLSDAALLYKEAL